MSNPETAASAAQLVLTLDQAGRCLTGLSPEQIAWRQGRPPGNSPAAIVTHLTGTTRVYALGFGCGLAVDRDRPAEFAPGHVSLDSLLSSLRSLSTDGAEHLPAIAPDTLATSFLPAQHLWGQGSPHPITPREGMIASTRYAALHLGEPRLVADWANVAAAG